jgi:signal transduction histidine kinase
LKESEDDKTRLKRQLTENIAHELKTPVSSIQGYLETIVNEPDLDSETKNRFIRRVYAQSQRLASLLEDISILNKLDDAPHTYESTEVNIAALLQLIQADTAPQLSSKNITYRALVDNDVIVRGNRSLLYSAFRNLTDNSIAYAGEGVTITIRMTEETEDAYAFSFSDNGVGVPSEHLPRLFERFYRVDKGRSRKLGGTGLGLAIVKNAVLLHHGTISASITQTGGLEFDFIIAKTL